MKPRPHSIAGPPARRIAPLLALYWCLAGPRTASASLFQGETLDSIANAISWVVIILAPVIAITVFWLVHILPEKIAEKKKHPQTGAIQCLCLLSLCFGGLLWPLAWLWAYTKPVLHKLAYGTDEGAAHGATATSTASSKPDAAPAAEPVRRDDRTVDKESTKHRSKGGRA